MALLRRHGANFICLGGKERGEKREREGVRKGEGNENIKMFFVSEMNANIYDRPNSSNIHQNQTLARRQFCKLHKNGVLTEAWRKFYMVRREGEREGQGETGCKDREGGKR